MRYLSWLLRFLLFVVVLSFAVRNTEIVTLRYYFGYEWQAPLVLLLLLFFAAGVSLGIAAGLPHLFRQRKEIARLRRQVESAAAEPALPGDVAAYPGHG